MKKIALMVLAATVVVFALASCQNPSPPHAMYIGYIIEYGEPDKKEVGAVGELGIETWTWYNKGENSLRAKVEFHWKKTSTTGLEWKVVETYP